MLSSGAFPAVRMRRLRRTPWLRALVADVRLHPAQLVWPIFLCEGEDTAQPVATMPGVDRLSVDRAARAAVEAQAAGIGCLALFPDTPQALRDQRGSAALDPDNLVCRALGAIRKAAPDLGLLVDVALDCYTDHGHDGLVDRNGGVDNDATVDVLAAQALVLARAGADIVAPSDMMDGRVAAIRRALDADGHSEVAIMAYSAKYASAFYGPFREAVGSAGRLKGDKRGYQMDTARREEALREVALDVAEGADMVMVKPAMPCLDTVARVAAAAPVPVFAYQVSGEYAMLEAAAAAGAFDRRAAILESLTAIVRAGAQGVLSYHALEAARWLAESAL